MTRIHLDDLTSDRLDALYARLESAEAAIARAHRLASDWAVLRAHGSAATELRAALRRSVEDTRPDTSTDIRDGRIRTPPADRPAPDINPSTASADTVRTRPDTREADSVRTVAVRRVRRDQVRAAFAAAFDLPADLVDPARREPPCRP